MSIALSEGVTIETVAGSDLLLREEGDIAVLNHTAGLVLRGLLAGGEIDEVVDSIVGRFEVNEAKAKDDVVSFLGILCSQNYIRTK